MFFMLFLIYKLMFLTSMINWIQLKTMRQNGPYLFLWMMIEWFSCFKQGVQLWLLLFEHHLSKKTSSLLSQLSQQFMERERYAESQIAINEYFIKLFRV